MIAVHVDGVTTGWQSSPQDRHGNVPAALPKTHLCLAWNRSADDLGQVRQNQQQRGGEKNEPGLTNFRCLNMA
jgi:hypothetical protein